MCLFACTTELDLVVNDTWLEYMLEIFLVDKWQIVVQYNYLRLKCC